MDKEIEPTKTETKDLICADCLDSNDEDISESFICCVCLDLLYKPIVLACGHVSCFWCVHLSMNGLGESSCPICRHQYHHFPTICEVLNSLIVKLYPNAYHRRDSHMLEEEKKMDSFSPKFDISSLKSNGDLACSSVATEEKKTLNQISITDVLCPTCKNLLFRPAVLNCGHAYCETCITIPEDELIICAICESPHPCDFPKVCLELNNFLEKTFPEDYMARRDSIERQRVDLEQQPPVAGSSKKKSDSKDVYASSVPSGDLFHWLTEYGPKVHIGAGCDYCGVYPIVGTRYRCKDCKESVGFDLCERCYNTQSKLPGRFNQQHTAEHKFEVLLTSKVVRSLMLSSIEYGAVDLSAAASEEFEGDIPQGITAVTNQRENADNNEDGSAESNMHSDGDQSNNIQ